jgi:ubiquinone/menaquinone biosynthesis C-methylase UbiE
LSYEGEIEDEIIQGRMLYCGGCNQEYPVEEGIPRFIKSGKLFGLNKEFEKAYNKISYIYDSHFTKAYLKKRFWPSSGEEKARKEVVERLEINRYSRVLETAIGSGDNIPCFSENARKGGIYGLDISIGMLKQCLRNLKKWKCEAELFLANAEELPFRDESFDVVFHLGGMNFFTEKKKAVEEMIRVARPGTKIIIACETEKAIETNKTGIRFAFGRRLVKKMLRFESEDMRKLVPDNMLEIKFKQIWEGNGYLIEFRKPVKTVSK